MKEGKGNSYSYNSFKPPSLAANERDDMSLSPFRFVFAPCARTIDKYTFSNRLNSDNYYYTRVI